MAITGNHGGKLVEQWINWDMLGALPQLGVANVGTESAHA